MKPFLCLLLFVLAAYHSVIHLGFVSDDNGLVLSEFMGIATQDFHTIFGQDLWHHQPTQSGYYRPLMLLSLWVDHALWGTWAGGYHLHSLLWHLAATSMLFGLSQRLLGPHRALVAAGLFSMHPLMSEVVCFISARNDSMAIALSLAAVWAAMPRKASAARVLVACILAALACLSKETGVVGLTLLPILDLARHGRLVQVHRYAALATGAFAWLFMREMWGPGLSHAPSMPGLELLQENRLLVLIHLLGKISWPLPLTDSAHMGYLDWTPMPGALATVFLLLWLGFAGGRLGRAGVFFAFVALAPSFLAIASRFLIGERYLAMPLVGLTIAMAALLPEKPGARWLLILTLPFAWVNQGRIHDWKTDLSLARSAHAAAPTPYTASWLGHELAKAGDYEKAIPLLEMAIEGTPPTCDFAADLIRSSLASEGPASATLKARMIWDARCATANGVRGTWSTALLLSGDEATARNILSPPPKRCTESLAPAVIALAQRDGNEGLATRCAKESGLTESKLRPVVKSILAAIPVDETGEAGQDTGETEDME